MNEEWGKMEDTPRRIHENGAFAKKIVFNNYPAYPKFSGTKFPRVFSRRDAEKVWFHDVLVGYAKVKITILGNLAGRDRLYLSKKKLKQVQQFGFEKTSLLCRF